MGNGGRTLPPGDRGGCCTAAARKGREGRQRGQPRTSPIRPGILHSLEVIFPAVPGEDQFGCLPTYFAQVQSYNPTEGEIIPETL